MCQNHYIIDPEKRGRYGINPDNQDFGLSKAGIGGYTENEDMINGKMKINTEIDADFGAPGNDKKKAILLMDPLRSEMTFFVF
jgi:hypothetical protein